MPLEESLAEYNIYKLSSVNGYNVIIGGLH